MTGLALSGGGLKGAYEVGVYKAFLECHIKIDGFVGTSIGALNAAALASGKFHELYDFWQNIDAGEVFGFTNELSDEVNNSEHIDFKLVKEIASNIKSIVKNKGISTSGIRKVLEAFELEKELYKSKKDFGLCTVRADGFKPIYIFKEQIEPRLLNDYLIASCSLPIFKLEKMIDNNYYLDGGFHDNIPVNSLLARGYDKVYAIDLNAIGLKRPASDKNKVVYIRPSRRLGSILDIKQEDIRRNIQLGYLDALKILKNLDGNKYLFKVKSKIYYEFLVKRVDKKLLLEMKKFFRTSNPKKLVIKALEYVMKKNNYDDLLVYSPGKVMKEIRGMKKNYGVYKFIEKLKII